MARSRVTNAELQRRLEEANAQVAAAESALVRFKSKVRDEAIRVADEQSWCDDGLNQTLERLGLERKETDYSVRVNITITFNRTTADPEAVEQEFTYRQYTGYGLSADDNEAAKTRVLELLKNGEFELIEASAEAEEE